MLKILRNKRGSISGFLVVILAIAGAWYGYRSYKAGNLSNDLYSMLTDCQRITGNITMTSYDRALLTQAYTTITQVAAKYNVTPPAPTTTP